MKKQNHLTFDERVTIQMCLDEGISIHQIAYKLERPDSSIAREIKRNRYNVVETSKREHPCAKDYAECKVYHGCGDQTCKRACFMCYEFCCTNKCDEYTPKYCKKTTNSPYVCNGCDKDKRKACNYPKYLYLAKRAQINYEDVLRSSREGLAITKEDMQKLDNLVSPLLLKGQSIRTVYMRYKDNIPCGERSLYKYIEGCYLTARNIDLPRKVHFKTRYKHKAKRNMDPFAIDRTYLDFKRFMEAYPDTSVVEMDTVIGRTGGKVLLTLLFESCNFMIAILMPNKSQESVIRALNTISNRIGIENFRRLFGVILTDRGTEFSNPLAIECDEYGEIKTQVFYCDPYCSWQKGKIERNHEFIRYVLPKGTSFDYLTQKEITLLMNHINNYPREGLNGSAPYELAKLLIGDSFLKALHFHKIPADNVILKPFLLRQPKYKDFPEK